MIGRASVVMLAAMAAVLLAAAGAHADITLEMVTVRNLGNADDTTGYGRVDYTYQISKYEVTAGQYTAFLNAVAATDAYGLYNTEMWLANDGCKIERQGSAGSYTYSVALERANRPVNYVSFFDIARFCNWLHNGQGNGGTEGGAYVIELRTEPPLYLSYWSIEKQSDARYWIPTMDEWYKAAYHKNDGVTGNYWDYPTSSVTIDTAMANFGDTVGHATDVGAYPSASPYGTFDQAGNVWEMLEPIAAPPEANTFYHQCVGGSWRSESVNEVTIIPTTADPEIGFRVASVPEPSIFTFYNNSSWDDGNEAANAADDDAIAPDKVALQPGIKATLANYTSYDKGINGLMIDLHGLGDAPTLNDFLFRLGNDNAPYGDDLDDPADDWPWAPDPIAIAVRPGAGQDGADRVTLIWEDGLIRNCWLQVTVLATDATGLAENEVFYVGNAVGESGNSTTDALVNATDEIGARNNPHSPFAPAPKDDAYDYNRDRLVNATDQIIARNNRTNPFTALKLITPPLEDGG